MKIKKFPQSCVLVKSDNTKILIDPGKVDFDEKFLDDWKTADCVLITHKHSDHINVDILAELNIPIYSTNEVEQSYPTLKINVIKAGSKFKVGSIKIEAVKAVHGYISQMGEVIENVGYILDDGKQKFYASSDTIRFNGIEQNKCDVIMIDCTAFDASMNLWGAMQTYKDVQAKLLIIAHQESGKMIYDKKEIEQYLNSNDVNFVIPKIGEIISI